MIRAIFRLSRIRYCLHHGLVSDADLGGHYVVVVRRHLGLGTRTEPERADPVAIIPSVTIRASTIYSPSDLKKAEVKSLHNKDKTSRGILVISSGRRGLARIVDLNAPADLSDGPAGRIEDFSAIR